MQNNLLRSSNDGADESDIATFERNVGVKLPQDYRSFLQDYNGCELVNNIVRSKNDSVYLTLRFLHGLSPRENVLFSGLESMQECYENGTPDGYVVIGDDWGGNQFMMLATDPYTIFWWDHDDGETYEIAEDFTDLIARIESTPPEPETPVEELGRTARTKADLDAFLVINEPTPQICYEAVKNGNIELLKLALNSGIPAGHVLRVAAINGEFEIFDFLVENGFRINGLMDDGRTVLDWTTWKDEYYQALRKRGAKLSSEL